MKRTILMMFAFLVCVFGASAAQAEVCGSGATRNLVPDTVGFDAQGKMIPFQQAQERTRGNGLVSQRVSFAAACAEHDRCYGSKGARKSACDTRFYRGMLASCRTTIPGTAPEAMRRACVETAMLYNDVVRGQETIRKDIWGFLGRFTGNSGCNAFRAAQGNPAASCD